MHMVCVTNKDSSLLVKSQEARQNQKVQIGSTQRD